MARRRFSRRDALRASENTGREQTRACHRHGRIGDRVMAKKEQGLDWRDAFLAGVQSPPLQGGKPSMDGPAGETPKMTPREFFRRGLQSLIIPRLFDFGAQDLGFSCLRRPICKFPFWIPGRNSEGSLSPRGARVVPSRSLQPERARDWI